MTNDRLIVTAKAQNTPMNTRLTVEEEFSFNLPVASRANEAVEKFAGLMILLGYHQDSIKQAMEEYQA